MTELEHNLDTASSTRNLLTEKRDMLQGDVKQRLVVHRFHTDVWDACIAQGSINQIDDVETVVSCYEQLREVNELMLKFNEEGNVMLHSPLISREGRDYGRDHVVDMLKELCEQAEGALRDAYAAVDRQMSRTCPICDQQFESKDACDEHMQTAHQAE
jgi:hypothetical protein